VNARREIERIVTEHRATIARFVDRIDGIERAARERSARLPAERPDRAVAVTRTSAEDSRGRALGGPRPDELEVEEEPRTSWLG
jgi:hypothetical protein